MASVEEQLSSLVLAAGEIKTLTGWPDPMIEDYLNLIRNLVLIASNTDSNIASITQNADDIDANEVAIAVNVAAITANAVAIAAHIALTIAHGSAGDIIGNLDTTELLVKGPVFLAVAVADAVASTVSVTSADASAAPGTYDQTQNQEIVDLANEMKGDINTLVTNVNSVVTQLNDLLAQLRLSEALDT